MQCNSFLKINSTYYKIVWTHHECLITIYPRIIWLSYLSFDNMTFYNMTNMTIYYLIIWPYLKSKQNNIRVYIYCIVHACSFMSLLHVFHTLKRIDLPSSKYNCGINFVGCFWTCKAESASVIKSEEVAFYLYVRVVQRYCGTLHWPYTMGPTGPCYCTYNERWLHSCPKRSLICYEE